MFIYHRVDLINMNEMFVYAHLKDSVYIDFERLFLPPSHSKGSEDVHFWIRVGKGQG